MATISVNVAASRRRRSNTIEADGSAVAHRTRLMSRKRRPLSEVEGNISTEDFLNVSQKRVKPHDLSPKPLPYTGVENSRDGKQSPTSCSMTKAAPSSVALTTAPKPKLRRRKNVVHRLLRIPLPNINKSKRESHKDDEVFKLDGLWHAIQEIEIPSDVTNVDKNEKDLFQSPEYAADFIMYLKKKEIEIDDMKHGADTPKLNLNARSVLINWLIQVQDHLKLEQDSLHLAVGINDLFISKKEVPIERLQLVGVASLFIAAKFVERFAPEVQTLVHLTDNTFEYQEIIQMELEILCELKYSVSLPLASEFINRFITVNRVTLIKDAIQTKQEAFKKHSYLCSYLVDMSLVDYKLKDYIPSKIAAASLLLANMNFQQMGLLNGDIIWNRALEFYTGYDASELTTVCERFVKLLKRVGQSKYQGAYQKYLSSSFERVSSLPTLWDISELTHIRV